MSISSQTAVGCDWYDMSEYGGGGEEEGRWRKRARGDYGRGSSAMAHKQQLSGGGEKGGKRGEGLDEWEGNINQGKEEEKKTKINGGTGKWGNGVKN